MNWKPVPNYEGLYEVSDTGLVNSLERITDNGREGTGCKRRIAAKRLTFNRVGKNRDYNQVKLYRSGVQKSFGAHVLVAMAFVPNPLNLPEVNHKDGQKTRNVPSNLEWCTHYRNCEHARETGLAPSITGASNPQAKLNEATVAAIRSNFAAGLSQTQISKQTGVPLANIHCIVRRKSWTHI